MFNFNGQNLVIKRDKMYLGEGKGTTTKKMALTIDDIHSQMQEVQYRAYYNSLGGEKAMDSDIENFATPPMNRLYYTMVFENGRIPSIQELCEKYKELYCDQAGEDTLSFKAEYTDYPNFIFREKDLFGRICRAYNSFNREIELLLQILNVSRSNKEIKVWYSLYDDFVNGIDICIEYRNVLYGVASYISSKNSTKWRKVKVDSRHSQSRNFKEAVMIPVVACFRGDNCNVVDFGDVKVHTPDIAEKIVNIVLGKSTVAALQVA